MKLIEIRDDTFMFIRNKKTGVVLTKIKDDDNTGLYVWAGNEWRGALGPYASTKFQTKVTGVAGNVAGFDANGNLSDLGHT